MPTQYVSEEIAELIKKETVRVTRIVGKPVSRSDIVKVLILKGIKEMNTEDWKEKIAE